MDEFSDGKAIFAAPQKEIVWSRVDDPNKWEVQEPYGYFRYDMGLDAWVQNREDTKGVALYTTPPKREWVGLTDEDIAELRRSGAHSVSDANFRDIETRLKEKNCG